MGLCPSFISRRIAPSRSDMITDEAVDMHLTAWRAGLIAPDAKRKGQWDWFVLLLVLYTSITVPFCVVFYDLTSIDVSYGGFAVDTLVDICYLVDIFVSLRTTYYDNDGQLVLDKKVVRARYLKAWFWLDVFASFPYMHVAELIFINSSEEAPASLRLPSLAKLLRMVRLGKKIDRLSTSKIFRIGQFTFMLLMSAHWYACIWFWAGESAPPDPVHGTNALPGVDGTSWVYRMGIDSESVTMQYTASLYWSLTTLMKSPWLHPNSPEEFAGGSLMIIVGCVLFAYFIGNVTAVITAANAAGGRYRGQVGALKSFCQSSGLNTKLTHKLLLYNDVLWNETAGGTDRTAMLKSIPPHLLPEVTIAMYRPLLDACPFLHECTASGCAGFLSCLKVRVCDRSEALLRAGTLSKTMYILHRGEIKIDYEASAPLETAATYSGGRVGSKKKLGEKSTAKDAMRGRTDKFGTLLGFQDVFGKMEPLEYSVTALSRSLFHSIQRAELKELLSAYEADRETVNKAIDHANASIKSTSSGQRSAASMRRKTSDSKMDSTIAEEIESSAASPIGNGRDGSQAASDVLVLPATTEPLNGKGGAHEDIAALRAEVANLTKLVQAQSAMLETILAAK